MIIFCNFFPGSRLSKDETFKQLLLKVEGTVTSDALVKVNENLRQGNEHRMLVIWFVFLIDWTSGFEGKNNILVLTVFLSKTQLLKLTNKKNCDKSFAILMGVYRKMEETEAKP